MSQFNAHSTGLEVTAAFADQVRGKTILITGPTIGGIGYDTALSLASQQPKLLILAGRSQERLDAAIAAIEAQYPGTKTQTLLLDLASLASVRKAAAEVEVELDIIICNAALMALPEYSTSAEGFELQFAANHLAHFLLVNLLLPKLLPEGKDPAGKRIINVASGGYFFSHVRFDDINFGNGKDYDKWRAYGQSKSANMLFSLGLAQRLEKRGVKSYSLHPGSIETRLQRHIPNEELQQLRKEHTKRVVMKTLQEGCSTTLVAALNPGLADKNGAYLEDCNVVTPAKEWARDPEGARKLWELSEEMLGQKFEY